MRSKVIGGILVVIIGTQTMVAGAAEVRFVPPNDPVGKVCTYNDNDT